MCLLCRHNFGNNRYVVERIREYSRIIGQILDVSGTNTGISRNKNNGNVFNDVLNSDEHSESEDSDGFYSGTNNHENVDNSDLEIISSSTDGVESRREHAEKDHEITATNLGVIQPQLN